MEAARSPVYLSRFSAGCCRAPRALGRPVGSRETRREPAQYSGLPLVVPLTPTPKERTGRLTCFSYSCWNRACQGRGSTFAGASGREGQGRSFHSCTCERTGARSPLLLPFPRLRKGQGASAQHSFHFPLFLRTWSQFPSLLPFPGCGVTRAMCQMLFSFPRLWKNLVQVLPSLAATSSVLGARTVGA